MATYTLRQLAAYAADELDRGVGARTVWESVAATLIAQRCSRDVRRFGRALEAEMIRRGTTPTTITSAVKVDARTRQSLSKLLGVASPSYSQVIDPSVIGGVCIEADGRRLDLTVMAKMERLQRAGQGLGI